VERSPPYPLTFQLKGFKHICLRDRARFESDFVTLVGLLERIFTDEGDEIIEEWRRAAYDQARKIALEDGVQLDDLPKVAVAC